MRLVVREVIHEPQVLAAKGHWDALLFLEGPAQPCVELLDESLGPEPAGPLVALDPQ